MKFFVYILHSSTTGKYYCGQTNNLEDRIRRHNNGESKYTRTGVPWDLIKVILCSSRSESVQLESKIKKRGIKRYLEGLQ